MMEASEKNLLSELKEAIENTASRNTIQNTGLDTLVAEIKILSQQTAANIIEIGKRLNAAKVQVEHGEWGAWLESNFEFTERTAQRFMKAANEFSKTTALSDLSPTKIFALLDVPAADREAFIAQPHDVGGEQKTVDEMTSRELAQAIKALKDAERDKAAKDSEIQRQAQKLQKLESDLEQSMVAQKMLADLKKPETITVEKKIEVKPPDYEKMKFRLDTLENENKLLKLQADTRTEDERRKDRQIKAENFVWKIRSFVSDMASIGYIGSGYARLSQQGQKDYEQAISSLEKLCRDMRDQLILPREDQIYDMRGDEDE